MAEHLLQFSAGADKELSVTYERPSHRKEEFGTAALNGFTLMGEVESPWAEFRHELQGRIVDQDPAIDAIIDALDISAARLNDDPRPMANLAFLGPTGVGKSETAKVLADAARSGDGNLIKIDCSEFANGHEVANLTGSPKGYIGSTDEPRLSKDRVEKYGTVVLFDEIEKGSTELYNLMLQIMGDGKLQLGNGETTDFRGTIIILTSNLGAQEMANSLNPSRLGFPQKITAQPDRSQIEAVANRAFTDFFRPEFINRLDRTIVFHPLSSDGLERVLDTKLEALNKEYKRLYGARLSLSDSTKSHLVDVALEQSHMGARPLIRAFEQQVQSTFGRHLGRGAVDEGTHVRVFHSSEVGSDVAAGPFVFASERDQSLRRTVTRQPAIFEQPVEEVRHHAEQQEALAEDDDNEE